VFVHFNMQMGIIIQVSGDKDNILLIVGPFNHVNHKEEVSRICDLGNYVDSVLIVEMLLKYLPSVLVKCTIGLLDK
jgi:hypothetical protein